MSGVSSSRALSLAWMLCAAAVSYAQAPFPDDPHRELVVRVCSACHPPEVVVARRRTAAEWDEIVLRMIQHGAEATDEEQQRIIEYFARHYGEADRG
jgi:hypothetical protein